MGMIYIPRLEKSLSNEVIKREIERMLESSYRARNLELLIPLFLKARDSIGRDRLIRILKDLAGIDGWNSFENGINIYLKISTVSLEDFLDILTNYGYKVSITGDKGEVYAKEKVYFRLDDNKLKVWLDRKISSPEVLFYYTIPIIYGVIRSHFQEKYL